MVAAALMLTVYIMSRMRGYGGDMPKASLQASGWPRSGMAIPALILPLIIVMGVRFGVFTATEAGAIAFVYALLCGLLLYRKLTGANLVAAIRESMLDTVVIVVIIAAAAPFAWVLAYEQVPQKIAQSMARAGRQPVAAAAGAQRLPAGRRPVHGDDRLAGDPRADPRAAGRSPPASTRSTSASSSCSTW